MGFTEKTLAHFQKKIGSEFATQCAVFAWAKANEEKIPELKLLYAIPNGGIRDIVTASRLKKSGTKAGIPDIHLPIARVCPEHYTLQSSSLYIELKHGRNKLSQKQKKFKLLLEGRLNEVVVCYSAEEAILEIKKYLNISNCPQK